VDEVVEPGVVSRDGDGGTIQADSGSADLDRYALEIFYDELGGDGWRDNTNWLDPDKPLSEWFGVSTDADGRVTSLNLSANLLVGKIPSQIRHLTRLHTFSAGRNYHLVGPLPVEFFGLVEMHSLYLSFTRIGHLPPEIGNLTNLTFLGVSRAGLVGHIPPEIGNLTWLRSLYLNENYLFGEIPPEMGNLTELRQVRLDYNDLTGRIPSELGNLSRIVDFYAPWNQLSGEIPKEITNMSFLKHLDLRGNSLTGPIPDQIGNLDGLLWLHLGGNDLTGAIPASIGDLADLTHLYLQDNDLTGPLPEGIGNLSNLTRLWIANNEGIGGPIPVGMENLTNLYHFKAGGTELCAPEDAGLLSWLRGVPFHRLSRCEPVTAYLTQAVQSREFPVPLVMNRSALLRVFLSSVRANGEPLPGLDVEFFRNGRSIHHAFISQHGTLPRAVNEGDWSASADLQVPYWVVRPGLEVVINVDPFNEMSDSLGLPERIPAEGRMAVDVAEIRDIDLTLIPFLYEANPDSSIIATIEEMVAEPDDAPMLAPMGTLLPVSDWNIRSHEAVITSTNYSVSLMVQTEGIRVMEGTSGYWVGMMAPVSETGIFGIAYSIPSWSSFSMPLPRTFAHELGHNMGLFHAPCGGAGGPDPLYPYPSGTIGAWGYNRTEGELVSPHRADLMSYCGGQWISDYHFSNAVRHRTYTENIATFGPTTLSLLVWGGIDTEGELYLESSFIVDAKPSPPPRGNDFTLRGRSDSGEAFTIPFNMPANQDAGDEGTGFVFTIPVTWQGDLEEITVAGQGQRAVLDESTNQPLTILRNPVTGQIRAILNRPPTQTLGIADDSGFEVLFSRGVPR